MTFKEKIIKIFSYYLMEHISFLYITVRIFFWILNSDSEGVYEALYEYDNIK